MLIIDIEIEKAILRKGEKPIEGREFLFDPKRKEHIIHPFTPIAIEKYKR